ncbi:MAG: hypothetical protein MI741_20870 [Rhodospirillales bacterium]|nr:hypothetical protein [Rhodospirillales bacterium]
MLIAIEAENNVVEIISVLETSATDGTIERLLKKLAGDQEERNASREPSQSEETTYIKRKRWFRVTEADLPADEHRSAWRVSGDNIIVDETAIPPPPRRLVKKTAIIDRLQEVGLLDAARAAMDQAPTYTQERWNARDAVYADDPETIEFLTAIGADPDAILAEWDVTNGLR